MNDSRELGRSRRQRSRFLRPLTYLAATAGAALLALAFAAPASAAGDPSVTISPATGLSNGQTVTVTGSGYAAGVSVNLVECAASAQGAAGCDVSTFQPVKADSSGGFTASFKVVSTFGSTDCTKVACVINGAAGTSPSAPTGTSSPLQFAAAVTTTSSAPPTSSAPTSAPSSAPTSVSVAPTSASTAPSAVVPGAVNSGSGTPPNAGMIAGGVALLVLGGGGLFLATARRRHAVRR